MAQASVVLLDENGQVPAAQVPGTSAATPSAFVRRDQYGNASYNEVLVAGQTTGGSATRKDYVDAGDVRAIGAGAASDFFLNSTFADWSGTTPAGFGVWSHTVAGTSMVKDTTAGRRGPNAIRYVVAAAADQIGMQYATNQLSAVDNEFYLVELDFMLLSGDSLAGAGMLLDWNGTTQLRATIDLGQLIPAPVIQRWYRVSQVLRRPSAVAGYTGTNGYLMANWSTLGSAVKTMVYDRMAIRPATPAEIDTHLASSDAAAPGTLVRRTAANSVSLSRLYLSGAPTVANDATRKDYVDAAVLASAQRVERYVTASTTLVAADAGEMVSLAASTAATVTIPTNSAVPFPIGTVIEVMQSGVGRVTVARATGVSCNAPDGSLALRTQGSRAQLIKTGTDAWWLDGDLVDPASKPVALALTTSFAHFDPWARMRYWREGRTVYVQGMAQIAAGVTLGTGSETGIFGLPAGFRPPTAVMGIGMLGGTNFFRVDFSETGAVELVNSVGRNIGAGEWFLIDSQFTLDLP